MTKQFHPIAQCNDGVVNTSSGKIIDLKNPTTDMIDIKDIATSLSHICRFGGHVNRFYSVAQHSVLVYRLVREYGEGYELEALLHDATETYVGDVVKPLKVILGDNYKQLEQNFECIIARKFDLRQAIEVERLVKRFDMEALELEHEAFQKGNYLPLMQTMERLELNCGHINWDVREAKRFFMIAFAECLGNREHKRAAGL